MSIEAIVSLLTRKGLITQQEILDELKAIRVRDEKEKNKEKKKGNHPEWEKTLINTRSLFQPKNST